VILYSTVKGNELSILFIDLDCAPNNFGFNSVVEQGIDARAHPLEYQELPGPLISQRLNIIYCYIYSFASCSRKLRMCLGWSTTLTTLSPYSPRSSCPAVLQSSEGILFAIVSISWALPSRFRISTSRLPFWVPSVRSNHTRAF